MTGAIFIVRLLALVFLCAAEQVDKSPIAKVVVLITEMKATVEKEATSDEDAYDKYSCWSLTNEKQKKAAIATNTKNVKALESFVAEAAGTTGQLTAEIKALKSDIEEDQAALDSANSQREKESEAFQAEEADMKETIGLLTQAIAKLQAVQLLQKNGHSVPMSTQGDVLLQVKQVAKHVRRHPNFNGEMQRDLFDVLGSLQQVAGKEARRQGSTLQATALLGEVFLPKRGEPSLFQNLLADEAKPNKLKGAAAGAKSYNSRSGPIIGMFKEMKDEFQRDLGSAQKEDLTALINFQHLNAAKSGEIAASTKQQEMKEGQLADLKAKVAESKESIESSNDAIDSDSKFLANVLKNRKIEDKDYEARVKTRSDEIVALGKTLEILTGDESRALFGKTISFLQVSTATRERMENQLSKKAMQLLMKIGRKHNNMALISMAVNVRLDAFKKVKAAMSKMTSALQRQQKAEYEKWEECKKEIDETEDEIKEGSETRNDLGEKHQDLKNTLSELQTSTNQLNTEVSEMSVELKKAGESRKAENLLFQSSISDQRATVAILNMALNKLKEFYSKAAFVQTKTSSHASQPETDEYSKSSGAGGVMQLLAKIITDAETEGQELAMTEADNQKAYAEFVQDTSASMGTARKAIAQKAKQSAAAKSEKSETEGALTANKAELEKLNKLLSGTHQSCDFLIKYFDTRQKARSEEMDAIGEATSILSGANYQ